MEARNRTLPDWFNRVRTGQVRLPRFQRHEAWGPNEVSGLLETVLRGLPAGAALVLEVGDGERFKSRPLVGAPSPTERATEQLLDGQQRLTALWRAFHDSYEDRTYFVWFEVDDDDDGKRVPRVFGQTRWDRAGARYPLWADDAAKVHGRGYIPLRLLRPGDITKDIREWCAAAAGSDAKAKDDLFEVILNLRDKVMAFQLPFLSLPATTPTDVALDVFIKMNTSAVQLTAFDIVVAQVEDEAGQSLHELVGSLGKRTPAAEAYAWVADWALGAAALRADRSPGQGNFLRLDVRKLVSDWDEIGAGIAFAVSFLEEERIYDADRLPTAAVLPVLAALHATLPKKLDALGSARTLLRKYVWRAFATHRYESAAATRALQDFKGLRSALVDPSAPIKVPIFDETSYPIPSREELARAGWPKGRDILARAILAVSLRGGARDLADGAEATRSNLPSREYHHLFPDSLLQQDGGLEYEESFRALNCALITWTTNRNISAKEPIAYLKERVAGAALGEPEIRSRLATHAIPFDTLNVGGYAKITDANARRAMIRTHYADFLAARAALVEDALNKLCSGHAWSP